jgi:hypothetical protein
VAYYHSGARNEAQLRGLADELAEFNDERSDVSAALTYCDMHTGPTGEAVTLDERLVGVARRYGLEHVVSRALVQATGDLVRQVEQVERALAASR